MLPPEVEGMSWEMPLLFFPISGCPILEWHSKMDRAQLVTNVINKKEEEGNEAVLQLFSLGRSILIHI